MNRALFLTKAHTRKYSSGIASAIPISTEFVYLKVLLCVLAWRKGAFNEERTHFSISNWKFIYSFSQRIPYIVICV